MGEIIKSILKGIGFRGFVLMALVGATAYLGSQGISKYHQIKTEMAKYEQTAKSDANEKIQLRQKIDAQTQRAEAAENNTKLLTDQMAHQQAENQRYKNQLSALEAQREKDDAQTQKTLQRLNHELSLAGVHNTRVPDSIIRMQRQAVCRTNGTCASSNGYQNVHTATSKP